MTIFFENKKRLRECFRTEFDRKIDQRRQYESKMRELGLHTVFLGLHGHDFGAGFSTFTTDILHQVCLSVYGVSTYQKEEIGGQSKTMRGHWSKRYSATSVYIDK